MEERSASNFAMTAPKDGKLREAGPLLLVAPRPSVANMTPAHHCRMTLPTPCSHPSPCGMPCELNLGPERHAVLELGYLARLAVMAVPGSRRRFCRPAGGVFAPVVFF